MKTKLFNFSVSFVIFILISIVAVVVLGIIKFVAPSEVFEGTTFIVTWFKLMGSLAVVGAIFAGFLGKNVK